MKRGSIAAVGDIAVNRARPAGAASAAVGLVAGRRHLTSGSFAGSASRLAQSRNILFSTPQLYIHSYIHERIRNSVEIRVWQFGLGQLFVQRDINV